MGPPAQPTRGREIDLNQANQLLGLNSVRSRTATENRIETPGQAQTILDRITSTFDTLPDLALGSQSAGVNAHLIRLLEAAPT